MDEDCFWQMRESKVVFPAPEGPMMANISPGLQQPLQSQRIRFYLTQAESPFHRMPIFSFYFITKIKSQSGKHWQISLILIFNKINLIQMSKSVSKDEVKEEGMDSIGDLQQFEPSSDIIYMGRFQKVRRDQNASQFLQEVKKYVSFWINIILIVLVCIVLYLALFSQPSEVSFNEKVTQQYSDTRIEPKIAKYLQNIPAKIKVQLQKEGKGLISSQIHKQIIKNIQKLDMKLDEKVVEKEEINKDQRSEMEKARNKRQENIIVDNINLHQPLGSHIGHPQWSFQYDTMGMKKNERFNDRVVPPAEYYRFEESFFDFLKPYNDTTCELERLGDPADGGYPVCVNLLNHSKGLLNLGIEGRDRLGCELTSRQKMPNYQYDCTNGMQPSCDTNSNSNHFFSGCLGERTEKSPLHQFYSMKEMIDRSNLTGQNFILKMDVQGAEWQGFKTLPIEYLKLCDQILMELHLPGPSALLWITLREGNLEIMKALQQNFYSVYLHMNPGTCLQPFTQQNIKRKVPAFAIEISLVNKRIASLKSNTRNYKVNAKNENYVRRCDLND